LTTMNSMKKNSKNESRDEWKKGLASVPIASIETLTKVWNRYLESVEKKRRIRNDRKSY